MHSPLKWFQLTLAAVLALSASALGAPLPGSAIESSVARFLLSETDDGLALMSRYLGRTASASDFDDFLRSLREAGPGANHIRLDLEIRIGRLRKELHRARVERNGGRELKESNRFSPEEQSVLRDAAKQEFSLSEHARPVDPQAGRIRFAEREPIGLEASREEFLNPAGAGEEALLNVKTRPLEKAPESIKREARKSLKSWATDAQTCLENRPAGISKSAEKRDLLQQLAITASVNTGTYFLANGFTNFDAHSFGLDLMTSLSSTGISMYWMKSRDTFQIRWLKVFSWGQVRPRLEAELFKIIPGANTHGVSLDQAAHDRKEFNLNWAAATSVINPTMFTVLSGAECLISESKGAGAAAKFARGAFAVKFGVSVGMSFLYYKARSEQLNSPGGKH